MNVGRVVIIDDDPELRRATRLVLTKAGYDAFEAADGSTILRFARWATFAAEIGCFGGSAFDGVSSLPLPQAPSTSAITRRRFVMIRARNRTRSSCAILRTAEKDEGPLVGAGLQNPGSVLLSHRLAPAVPSALESLTSVFGMGTGVTSPV